MKKNRNDPDPLVTTDYSLALLKEKEKEVFPEEIGNCEMCGNYEKLRLNGQCENCFSKLPF
jgi:hypothetical protein